MTDPGVLPLGFLFLHKVGGVAGRLELAQLYLEGEHGLGGLQASAFYAQPPDLDTKFKF